MFEEETAIKIHQVSKVYPLYQSHRDRLKEALHPFRKKYHQDFYALRDVSFEIKKGETVGIIGRNGSGKSTLLSIIAGVTQPSQGKVEVRGRISSLLELGAGFNPELSGLENIFFYGLIAGLSKQEMEQKLQRIIDFAEIGEFLYQPMKVYSSGMYVRLAFSCAIHIEPEILIIDEALAVGDMNFQAKCMTAISRIQQGGATVLFVSHDIGSVKSLCSRALYLERGMTLFFGSSDEAASLYVKKMREELNEEARRFSRVSKGFEEGTEDETSPKRISGRVNATNEVIFKAPPDFKQRADLFRYGNGEARVTFVELLNADGEIITTADFDEKVTLKVHFEVYRDADIAVNFNIQDDKKIFLFGGNPRLAGQALPHCQAGGRYVATFEFRLPLREGNYSIQAHLSIPLILDERAAFLDVVEDALVINIRRRPSARVWAKMYLPIKFEIEKVVSGVE